MTERSSFHKQNHQSGWRMDPDHLGIILQYLDKYSYGESRSDKFGVLLYELQKIENLEGESLDKIRARLNGIEGRYSKRYFTQIFGLLPESIRPESRKNFKAYDGTNTIFNLAYEILSWKVHRALIKAKLEPYLGFLHSVQYGKPSLVCDFMELYRYLMDDFLIEYCRKLRPEDFIVKTENLGRIKQKKKIKEWYTLRSKIVHGIKVNLDQEKLQELADCLKKSIVWFLNQKNVDHDKIIDELDLG